MMTMRRGGGFSLTELVVVIAIITILAAILLPTLDQAMEQARRVQCAGNQKQWHIAAMMRAGDNNDTLPSAAINCRVWGRGMTDSFVLYLKDYLSVPIKQSGVYALVADYRNVAFCPSMQVVTASGDWCYDHHVGYMSPGFSLFNETNFGLARIGAMTSGGQGRAAAWAPIALVQDPVCLVPPNGAGGSLEWMGQYANNHQTSGGNVLAAAGNVRWLNASSWYSTYRYYQNGLTYFSHPMGYYSQEGYATAAPSSPYYGALTVYYPDADRSRGLNHQPEDWAINRRMFGYR